jgi:hypothetical protein
VGKNHVARIIHSLWTGELGRPDHGFREAAVAAPLKSVAMWLTGIGWEKFDDPRRKDERSDIQLEHLTEETQRVVRAYRKFLPDGQPDVGTLTHREILQHLGTEVLRNHWSPHVFSRRLALDFMTYNLAGLTVVTDIRFPEEVAAVQKYGGETWMIVGPARHPDNGLSSSGDQHVSEHALADSLPDLVINNSLDQTEAELRACILGHLTTYLALP